MWFFTTSGPSSRTTCVKIPDVVSSTATAWSVSQMISLMSFFWPHPARAAASSTPASPNTFGLFIYVVYLILHTSSAGPEKDAGRLSLTAASDGTAAIAASSISVSTTYTTSSCSVSSIGTPRKLNSSPS